ncbi:MAG: hypothetical protein ACF8R7_04275 [Phycisphaerales bacterium JB039]
MTVHRTLSDRIRAEFDSREQRQQAADAQRAKAAEEHEQRLARFTEVCEDLKSVWRPRIEEFAAQFGEKIKVKPTVEPGQRQATLIFMTQLANITLRLSASANPDFTKLVLDYDLLIIPVFFDYQRHARLEMPLDRIDRDAVGAWIDDQLVSCVRAWLTIQDNELYVRRAMVEDPITKARFLREDAAATIEHKGQKVYFSSEDSLRQFKEKHQIT